nr:MAG TPA: holin [Caudoviricetes sp.]
MKLKDKTYDILSWVGKIVLPALAVLYTTLGNTWGLPYVEQIPATIMAVDVFLNALLGISSNAYYKEKANQNTEV